MARTTADPAMKAPCARPANGSALPCQNRCSASAGASADLIAIRFNEDVKRSSAESASAARTETDPEAKYARAFIATRNNEIATEAKAARRIRLAEALVRPCVAATVTETASPSSMLARSLRGDKP